MEAIQHKLVELTTHLPKKGHLCASVMSGHCYNVADLQLTLMEICSWSRIAAKSLIGNSDDLETGAIHWALKGRTVVMDSPSRFVEVPLMANALTPLPFFDGTRSEVHTHHSLGNLEKRSANAGMGRPTEKSFPVLQTGLLH